MVRNVARGLYNVLVVFVLHNSVVRIRRKGFQLVVVFFFCYSLSPNHPPIHYKTYIQTSKGTKRGNVFVRIHTVTIKTYFTCMSYNPLEKKFLFANPISQIIKLASRWKKKKKNRVKYSCFVFKETFRKPTANFSVLKFIYLHKKAKQIGRTIRT